LATVRSIRLALLGITRLLGVRYDSHTEFRTGSGGKPTLSVLLREVRVSPTAAIRGPDAPTQKLTWEAILPATLSSVGREVIHGLA
jgi:hypothetical protein